jgi:hypothetical protein
MKKPKRLRDPETDARRKLTKAQESLRRSQEKRMFAAAKGEEEVEKASRRANSRLKKATLQVERKADQVTRIESRLLTLTSTLVLSSNVTKEKVSSQRHETKESASPESDRGHILRGLEVPQRADSSEDSLGADRLLSNGSEQENRELPDEA